MTNGARLWRQRPSEWGRGKADPPPHPPISAILGRFIEWKNNLLEFLIDGVAVDFGYPWDSVGYIAQGWSVALTIVVVELGGHNRAGT